MIHAELSEDTLNPKLLPKDHHLKQLVIQNVHEKLCHAGVSHTLAQLRKQYWIPQGRAMVKKVLRHCLICRTYEGGPFRLPAMAPWPRERVSKATPFTYTGLDYLGLLYIKEKAETLKVWICLLSYRMCHPFGNNSRYVSIQIFTCPSLFYCQKRDAQRNYFR